MQVLARLDEITEDQWLELRQKGIGGSDAAAACGASRWKTPLALYSEKIAAEPIKIDSEAMWWGRALEPLIRERLPLRYEEETGQRINVKPWPVLLQGEEPWMLYTPDGAVSYTDDQPDALLELKSTTVWSRDEWEDGSLPVEYYYQVQHGMMVTGLPQALVAVLIGKELRWVTVPRQDEFIRTLRDAEWAFWQRVEKGLPPAPAEVSDSRVLNALYQDASESSVDLPALESKAARYVGLSKEIKALETEHDMIRLEIEAAMQDNKRAVMGAYSATWSRYNRTWFDSKTFRADHPDLWAQYQNTGPTGRFTVKEAK